MIGIYKIENLINHHIYIGQSNNIERRWKNEKISAFNPNDHSYNYPLFRAFRKYGIDNFSFEVIEECDLMELDEKEKYWINKYNSFNDGYNQTLGGDGSVNKYGKEKLIGIIKDLQETDLFQKEIAKKWNISEEMVQGINTGRYWHDNYIEYPIRKVKRNNKICKCMQCGVQITANAKLCINCSRLNSRKALNRPDKAQLKNMIRNKSFQQIGKDFSVSDNTIRKWCKSYNLPYRKTDIKKIKDEEWALL